MDVLADIVKNVLVIIIMSSFLELLLPGGAIKPFVRFAIGLFVLIAVLNPILGYLFHGHDFQVRMWDYTVTPDAQAEILQGGQEIQEQILSSNQQVLQEKLQGQINGVVLLVPGVQEVSTEARLTADGTVEGIRLSITPATGPKILEGGEIGVFDAKPEQMSAEEAKALKSKIIQVVKNMYGLDVEDIQINYEGG